MGSLGKHQLSNKYKKKSSKSVPPVETYEEIKYIKKHSRINNSSLFSVGYKY